MSRDIENLRIEACILLDRVLDGGSIEKNKDKYFKIKDRYNRLNSGVTYECEYDIEWLGEYIKQLDDLFKNCKKDEPK